MQKFPMTKFGARALEAELHNLITVERVNVIAAIAEARGHGDLSENADYDAAKEKQGFVEGRINEIKAKLSSAEIIDLSMIDQSKGVVFGATVLLLDLESEAEITYKLVGDDEANVKIGKISINTPVARSMIGKNEGDVVEVRTPNGIREYEILEVKFIEE